MGTQEGKEATLEPGWSLSANENQNSSTINGVCWEGLNNVPFIDKHFMLE